ncbi:tRNA-uridine aminocarboxypropyltransferase [Janthinobacterium sp. GB1R12]|uniref:tRNA-uridine aminocarboxypropyltransferase n=1 Tax=Janthinobacterium sp. GB1R12 TaxID=3424190 RepID=UPI003F271CCF
MTTRRTTSPIPSHIPSATSSPGAASSFQAEPAKRARCPVCLRAAASCICRWIVPVAHAVEVLILQHPLEVHNAKGSARLLHLSLPNSRLLTGEQFAPDALAELLAGKHNVLLYPDTPGDRSLGIAPPPALDPAILLDPARLASQLRLVVLDATWRKSRKMLYLNPALQQLPRLPLRDTPASHYLIRKAHAPDQLSTLEATCYALMQLEQDASRFVPLITAFDGFVAQQLSYVMPHGEKA